MLTGCHHTSRKPPAMPCSTLQWPRLPCHLWRRPLYRWQTYIETPTGQMATDHLWIVWTELVLALILKVSPFTLEEGLTWLHLTLWTVFFLPNNSSTSRRLIPWFPWFNVVLASLLVYNVACGTLSKAFLKSMNTKATNFLQSITVLQISVRWIIRCSIEWPDR